MFLVILSVLLNVLSFAYFNLYCVCSENKSTQNRKMVLSRCINTYDHLSEHLNLTEAAAVIRRTDKL